MKITFVFPVHRNALRILCYNVICIITEIVQSSAANRFTLKWQSCFMLITFAICGLDFPSSSSYFLSLYGTNSNKSPAQLSLKPIVGPQRGGGPSISNACSLVKEVISLCGRWIVMNICVLGELMPATAAVQVYFPLTVSREQGAAESTGIPSHFKKPTFQKASHNRSECGVWQPGAVLKYTGTCTHRNSQRSSHRHRHARLESAAGEKSTFFVLCKGKICLITFGMQLILFI